MSYLGIDQNQDILHMTSLTDFTAANGISVVLNISVNVVDIVKVNWFSNCKYSNAMYIDAYQTANGVKTFASSPVVPDAAADNEPLSQGQSVGAAWRLSSPLLDLLLKNSLTMKVGVGNVTFVRSATATHIDRYCML